MSPQIIPLLDHADAPSLGASRVTMALRKCHVRLMTASHAAVDIGSVGPHCHEFGDLGMVGSEVTHRIGCGGVSGECESLTAATPEIDVTTWTARARLLHPRGAVESIEGRRVRPDISERMLAHVHEGSLADFHASLERAAWVLEQKTAKG
jgi:hypothetical protein